MPVALIPDVTKARVATLLRSGRSIADVARMCDVATYSVTKIARKEGIEYKRTAPGSHWGKRGAVVNMTFEMTPEQHWRGQIYNARWGGGYAK